MIVNRAHQTGRKFGGVGSVTERARLNCPPKATPGKMQSQPACRAGEPSGQSEEASSEGLSLSARPSPAAPSSGRGYAPSPGRPAKRRWRRAPRGEMVQPTRTSGSDGVLDLGVAAMIGLQFQGLPIPVGDRLVTGEEGLSGRSNSIRDVIA